MRRAFAFLRLLCALSLLALAGAQAAEPEFPPLTGRVVDRAALLSERDEKELDAALARFEAETTDQIVVVTLESLQGLDVDAQLTRQLASGRDGQYPPVRPLGGAARPVRAGPAGRRGDRGAGCRRRGSGTRPGSDAVSGLLAGGVTGLEQAQGVAVVLLGGASPFDD